MAGDWIKIEHATLDKPEINRMSISLGIDHDAVIGKCLRLWVWADQQSSDGHALSVTNSFVDRITFCEGFARALLDVGWLDGRDGRLSIPNFDRHNGKTAKTRALSNDRKRKSRDCHDASVTKASPEKRREEKNIKKQKEHPWFEDEEFRELMAVFRKQSQTTHNWIVGDEVVQAWMYELSRHTIEQAKAMLRFSTGAGAKKPITNGDHDRKSGDKTGGLQQREVAF